MEQQINLTDLIFNAINDLFNNLFASVDLSLYSLLDNLCFIDSSILSNDSFQKILGTNSSEGIILICNSLFFGLLLYYSISFLVSHLIYSKIDSPKQFIFKSIIFLSIMNSSLWICENMIALISTITNAIADLGSSIFNIEINFSNFLDNINKSVYFTEKLNIFSFNGIVKSFSTFGFINLIFTYSLRYVMIQIFITLSPFAFFSLITSSSEWFFKVWFKAFISLLVVQILVILILVLSFSIPINTDSNFSNLLYVGIVYALTRSNNYIKELFGGISTTVNSNISSIINK